MLSGSLQHFGYVDTASLEASGKLVWRYTLFIEIGITT